MKCKKCDGTGEVLDPVEVGAMARKAREDAGVTLGRLAAALGVSACYLSDLELGKRGWKGEKVTIEKYGDALDEVVTLREEENDQQN